MLLKSRLSLKTMDYKRNRKKYFWNLIPKNKMVFWSETEEEIETVIWVCDAMLSLT
jgi:hypothetical protein